MLPPRGDEINVYLPVAYQSTRQWPYINLIDVAYGVSPIYTWLLGAFGKLPVVPYIAGRLLSCLCWLLAIRLCFPKGEIRFAELLLLLNPYVLIFACRLHPYTLGLLILSIALLLECGIKTKTLFAFLASNVQNFCAVSAVSMGLYASGGMGQRTRQVFLLSLAAAIGILFNWGLYGGRYPRNFIESSEYAPYLKFDGVTEGYFVLVPAFAGLYLFLFGNRRGNIRRSAGLGLVTLALASACLPALPLGPFSTALSKLFPNPNVTYPILVALSSVGLLRANRDCISLGLSLFLVAVSLSTLPYFYERYAWFALVPVLMVWARTSLSNWQPSRSQFTVYITIVAAFMVAYTAAGSV